MAFGRIMLPSGDVTIPLDRLAVFGHLWGVATLSSGLRWLNEDNAWGWPMIVAALVLLFRPRSLPALVTVMLTHVAFVAYMHPWNPNHLLFESLVDLCFLIVLIGVLRERSGEVRDAVYDRFAPAARVGLFVLYFYAVLHKINLDFLDPEVSCGTALLGMVANRFPVPEGPLAGLASIWGTLIVEAAIPVLLCFRRTRVTGVLLAAVFHFLLAQIPGTGLYSFTTMILAMLTLFLPREFPHELSARLKRLTPVLRPRVMRTVVLVGALALAVGGVTAHMRGRLLLFGVFVWSVWVVVMAVVCLPVLLAQHGRGPGPARLLRMRPSLVALPLILLLNGLSPYLGLKTLTSFSMVSNLRTEGERTNHLFMRRWIDLTGFQDDLVRVHETTVPDLRHYAENDLLLTHFEFRRICSRVEGDFRVEYERNDVPRSLVRENGAINEPDAVRPHAWYLEKLLGFRPVDDGPRMRCRK